MSVTYGFYDSRDHDRTYSAEQLSSIFDGVIEDGILLAEGDCLEVTPGTGLNVIVGTGRAWFEHTWTKNDPALTLPLAAAPADLDRIDTIVLTTNSDVETRANEIKVMTGAPSNYPVAPTLIDTTKLHYHPLANVRVRANATSIAAADISDLRGTERTPWAKGGKYNDEIIAEEYDQNKSYLKDDSVMYKGEVYRFDENTSGGPIDFSKCHKTKVMDEVNKVVSPSWLAPTFESEDQNVTINGYTYDNCDTSFNVLTSGQSLREIMATVSRLAKNVKYLINNELHDKEHVKRYTTETYYAYTEATFDNPIDVYLVSDCLVYVDDISGGSVGQQVHAYLYEVLNEDMAKHAAEEGGHIPYDSKITELWIQSGRYSYGSVPLFISKGVIFRVPMLLSGAKVTFIALNDEYHKTWRPHGGVTVR